MLQSFSWNDTFSAKKTTLTFGPTTGFILKSNIHSLILINVLILVVIVTTFQLLYLLVCYIWCEHSENFEPNASSSSYCFSVSFFFTILKFAKYKTWELLKVKGKSTLKMVMMNEVWSIKEGVGGEDFEKKNT